MNKVCRALVTRYILPPYQNLKQVNHPYLFQVNPPFYPSVLLLCSDDIKYWCIQVNYKRELLQELSLGSFRFQDKNVTSTSQRSSTVTASSYCEIRTPH